MIFLYILLIVIGCYLTYELIFWLTHRVPLIENEVVTLAQKRRIFYINNYYSFSNIELSADKDFKSKMNPKGKLYKLDLNLNTTPSTIASLLKCKKHEWIVVGFEKEQTVSHIWINKGFDNSSAGLVWDFESMANYAKENNFTAILFFHNHPNPNPNIYNCTKPSEIDLNTAIEYSDILVKKGINLIKFVCERGRHYRYYKNYVAEFCPISNFEIEIRKLNGIDKKTNYKLHRELRRTQNINYI